MTDTTTTPTDAEVQKANAIEGHLDRTIAVRAEQVKRDRPIPDRQRTRDALTSARRRQAWGEHHLAMAERHRATLTDLIAHHERAAEELLGKRATERMIEDGR